MSERRDCSIASADCKMIRYRSRRPIRSCAAGCVIWPMNGDASVIAACSSCSGVRACRRGSIASNSSIARKGSRCASAGRHGEQSVHTRLRLDHHRNRLRRCAHRRLRASARCSTHAKRRNGNGRGSCRHWMTVQWKAMDQRGRFSHGRIVCRSREAGWTNRRELPSDPIASTSATSA